MTLSNNLYESAAFLITEFEGEVINIEGKADHLWVTLEEAKKMMVFAESRYVLELATKELIKEGLLKD